MLPRIENKMAVVRLKEEKIISYSSVSQFRKTVPQRTLEIHMQKNIRTKATISGGSAKFQSLEEKKDCVRTLAILM